MLTIFIGVCALVVIIACVNNGEWGAAVITVVITLILIAMAADDRKNTKAWLNFRDYWANGGPNGKQRQNDVSVSRREQEEFERRRQANIESRRSQQSRPAPDASELQTFMCQCCGRTVQAKSYTVYKREGKMQAFSCPRCRKQNVMRPG